MKIGGRRTTPINLACMDIYLLSLLTKKTLPNKSAENPRKRAEKRPSGE
jgi:hypothetical protein